MTINNNLAEGIDTANILTSKRLQKSTISQPSGIISGNTAHDDGSNGKRKRNDSSDGEDESTSTDPDADVASVSHADSSGSGSEAEETLQAKAQRRRGAQKSKKSKQTTAARTSSKKKTQHTKKRKTKSASKDSSNISDDINEPGSTASPIDVDAEDEVLQEAQQARTKGGGSRERSATKLFFELNKEGSERECKVCKKIAANNPNKNIRIFSYSVSSGTSTLKNHLKSEHKNSYRMLLKLEKTAKNLPESIDIDSIESYFPKAAPMTPWSPEELALKCLRFITACDLPLCTVEKPEFRDLLLFLRPYMKPGDFPSRHSMADLAMKELDKIKADTKKKLHATPSRISFTADIWSSLNMTGYLGITAHFITNDLELDSELIGFRRMSGSHNGKNIAKEIFKILNNDYGLVLKGKLGWFVLDNASNNGTTMEELEKLFRAAGIDEDDWDAVTKYIRCLAHVFNLAVVALLKALTAEAYTSEAVAAAHDPSELDLKDPFVRLRKFIVAVRYSGQRRDSFCQAQSFAYPNKKITQNELGEWSNALQLVLDVVTRWSSTYSMLKRSLELKDAVQKMMSMFEEDFEKFSLDISDWKRLKLVAEILEKADKVQQLLSASQYPTLQFAIPAIEQLQSNWESIQRRLLEVNANDPTVAVLQEALNKLSDYYRKMEKSEAYGNAVILTPHIKMLYLSKWWNDPSLSDPSATLAEQARAQFLATYEKYYAPQSLNDNTSHSTTINPAESSLWDCFDIPASSADQRSEAEQFLDEAPTRLPSAGGPETLAYWKMKRQQWPHLTRMAMDYLAIPGSATPVERVWSSAAETDTKRRNRLSSARLEALQFLKATYRKFRVRSLTKEEQSALNAARPQIIDDMNLEFDYKSSTCDIELEEIEELISLDDLD